MPDREPDSTFRMEEVEESEYLNPPVLMRGALSLSCLGFLMMGGGGWLMLIPAIGDVVGC